jgi:translation elongation factor EF-1alpha
MKRIILFIFIACILLGNIFIIFSDLFNINYYFPYILMIFFTLVSFYYLFDKLILQRNITRKHSIAVIGFPQSGKTTLITAIFYELLKITTSKYKITIRGSTIDKVNEDIRRLDSMEKINPTTDQDLFAYRADVNVFEFPFYEKYKVEIGDCPGDDTVEFVKEYGEWFHKTPFFNWVMEADVFIFVIDLAMDYLYNDYQANITKAIRAAWMHLLEHHIDGKKNIKDKPVLLVFSKGDLLWYMEGRQNDNSPEVLDKIKNIGFGEKLPIKLFYPRSGNEDQIKKLREKYNEIITYLNNQSKYFSVHFASYFALYNKGDREEKMGINGIINDILP